LEGFSDLLLPLLVIYRKSLEENGSIQQETMSNEIQMVGFFQVIDWNLEVRQTLKFLFRNGNEELLALLWVPLS
jgi:hypothetical protein